MPRKRKDIPNPIVTLDRPRKAFRDLPGAHHASLRKPQNGYTGSDAVNLETMTEADERAYCETLVQGVFTLVGLDYQNYTACYNACVSKCMETSVAKAQTWSGWSGYRDVCQKMKKIAELTQRTEKYHILPATSVVAAIAVKRFRRIETDGKNMTTNYLIEYKTFEYAHLSIKNYTASGPFILVLDQQYIKSGAVRQYEKDKEANTQDLETEEEDSHDEMSDDDEDDLPLIRDTKTTDQGGVMNQAGIMLEVQQFEAKHARPREPCPPADITVTTSLKVTRQEVLAAVEPLWARINNERWQDDLNNALAQQLTAERVLVLPQTMKSVLQQWTTWTGHAEIKGWIQAATEDKTVHEWQQVETKPEPLLRSSKSPADTILKDLENLANRIDLERGTRTKIRQCATALRQYISRLEQSTGQAPRTQVDDEFKAMMDQTVREAMKEMTATLQGDLNSINTKIQQIAKRKYAEAFETQRVETDQSQDIGKTNNEEALDKTDG
ncbi:hypothetical protein ACHAQJ_003393 [Trichoderma viride]